MPKFINEEVKERKEKEQYDEMEKAQLILELARKESRIQELEEQSALMLFEIAQLKTKGGI
jgi:hypothetical protein